MVGLNRKKNQQFIKDGNLEDFQNYNYKDNYNTFLKVSSPAVISLFFVCLANTINCNLNRLLPTVAETGTNRTEPPSLPG